jgi:Asp-tRNA(Asn)/Glu-tRNA(Gln) amidotransferase A subunit family amidase
VFGGTVVVGITLRRSGAGLLYEAGLPAVAFPVGDTDDGLPLGAQLIGRPHQDEHLLAIVTTDQDSGRTSARA